MNADFLLVDIGNSRVKWGLASGGEISAGQAFPTDPAAFRSLLDLNWSSLPAPAAVHVSNVAGETMASELAAWVARRWNLPARFAASGAEAFGIVNGYTRPGQLGVDRWLALLAAARFHGLPACVADCGTALTIDFIDGSGHHRGGLIAPGPALMRRALTQNTLGIGQFVESEPVFPGRDTATGLVAGSLLAAAGFLEKSWQSCENILGFTPGLILTGGDGEAVGRWLSISYRYDADLVLAGLLTLAEHDA